jgi:endoglucanase
MKKLYGVAICLCACLSVFAQNVPVKIPIDTLRWYQQNYTKGGLSQLFDGDLNTVASTGWSKILFNYDAYYPLLPGEEMTIDSIRFYDREGIFVNTPLTLSIITDKWERKPIATFTGLDYKVWVGPYPLRPKVFKLDTPATNIRFLVLNINNNDFPAEIELYGSYQPGTALSPAVKTYLPLKNMFGINGFEWNILDGTRSRFIDTAKMNAMKNFRGFRHYMDWEKLEETEGKFTFNPVARGGWNYDTMYQRCLEEGIEVLADLKTLPPWMIATYPDSLQAWDNNPVRYGKSFSEPSSYVEMGRVAFQFAARYGSNRNVDTSLVSVNSTPKWTGDYVNVKKIGLGLIKYIECDNERDKWWKGRKGYLTGREYAANLSAFYDGHKNTMGPGVGVKNADPNMQVVMSGTATTVTDYLRGMIDWCREFRGYKADGSINLCWDVINFHLYSTDNSSSQGGSSTRGSAPELANGAAVARKFVQVAHDYCNDMPVWITEVGYDINSGSVLRAIPIGNKTALQTQADWILRTALMYSREGLKKAFFYKVYDDDTTSSYNFASSGLINADRTRKPAADFIFQANKLFGEYTYRETINSSPIVDRYSSYGGNMYALVVPDETGKTIPYTLHVGNTDSVVIYTPTAGSNDMSEQVVATPNGQLQITVTETPVFVVPKTQLAIVSNSVQKRTRRSRR